MFNPRHCGHEAARVDGQLAYGHVDLPSCRLEELVVVHLVVLDKAQLSAVASTLATLVLLHFLATLSHVICLL